MTPNAFLKAFINDQVQEKHFPQKSLRRCLGCFFMFFFLMHLKCALNASNTRVNAIRMLVHISVSVRIFFKSQLRVFSKLYSTLHLVKKKKKKLGVDFT